MIADGTLMIAIPFEFDKVGTSYKSLFFFNKFTKFLEVLLKIISYRENIENKILLGL